MHIITLRFSDNKTAAPTWMAAHNAWLDQGFADGVFLASGSLLDGSGGCIIALEANNHAIEARVAEDPFVVHGVVNADITGFKPGRLSAALASSMKQVTP